MVQSGGWEDGTPAWLAAARIFLLGSIVFGYLFSATLFLISARLMHHDKLKLETVCQSGSLDAVSTLWGPPPPELVLEFRCPQHPCRDGGLDNSSEGSLCGVI